MRGISNIGKIQNGQQFRVKLIENTGYIDHEIDIYRQITELWSQVMANKVPAMHLNTVKLHVRYMALKIEILEHIIMW